MNKEPFECKIITPMFMSGPDGKTLELRPPSFKGMMRFWWRSIHGHLSLKDLKSKEGKIFGSSDEEIGKSKFNIHIKTEDIKSNSFSPVPHRNFKIKGISPSQEFSIIISSQHKNLDHYLRILKLAIILGGFGKRARRGFGSIRIVEMEEINLKVIINLINEINGKNNYSLKNNKIGLDNNLKNEFPYIKEIQIGKEYSSWEKLIKEIDKAASNNKCDSLGFAKKKVRLASPIYVSVIDNSEKSYFPIISTLNTVFPQSMKNKIINYEKQNRFKEAIL
ncbi:MAG: type III-B CRISPR module RAMP protein Cmr1 [Candidatus Aenigmatarchaeota archaeon]